MAESPADREPGRAGDHVNEDAIDGDVGLGFDLTCPSCDADLARADLFVRYRVCPDCGRHFPVPARERLALLLDPDGFVETNAALLSLDPLVFHDALAFPDRLAEAQQLLSPPGLAEGVITGVGVIDSVETVVVVLDLALLGGTIGALAGEKITLALEQAAAARLPVVAVCASGRGPERAHEGMLALAQLVKIAAAAANLRRAGVPLIAVLAHPTSGGVYVGLAGQADIVLAEPGARIGLSLGTDHAVAESAGRPLETAETVFAHGRLDAIVERPRLRETLSRLLDLVARRGVPRADARVAAGAGHGPTSPRWEIGALARHPDRPSAAAFVAQLLPTFVELHGDRVAADDPTVICGLGRLGGVSVAVVAQERGRPSAAASPGDGRIRPEGFRKADRVMRLAARLELPVLVLIDGPGPAAGAAAEADGIGLVLAQALGQSSLLPVPIVSAILGEAGGVAALALGLGDRTLMLEHAVFTVAGPDGGLLAGRAAERAATGGGSARWLTARECQRLGVVDVVVPEPAPAAHADPVAAARLLGEALVATLDELLGTGPRGLLAERSRRVRTLGMTTPEGRAATRREALALLDLHDLPRHLARSIGEWRERLETRYRTASRFNRPLIHLRRPDLAGRISNLRASVAAGRSRLAATADEPLSPTLLGGVDGERQATPAADAPRDQTG